MKSSQEKQRNASPGDGGREESQVPVKVSQGPSSLHTGAGATSQVQPGDREGKQQLNGQTEAVLLGKELKVSDHPGPPLGPESGGRTVPGGDFIAGGQCLEPRTSVTARGPKGQKGLVSPVWGLSV